MNLDDRFAAMGDHLLRELRGEFPLWHITRDGPYVRAVLPGWGSLSGTSVAELRDRLRRYGGSDASDTL